MVSPGGRWVIAYNGEIYNHTELHQRLAGLGVQFRGASDTEVVLAAVEQWGVEGALELFEGMFAMALWDRRDRRLYLVRDRFGEKPLYVGWAGGFLGFSSELKALFALPGFAPELDRQAVGQFLRHSCIPAPHTIYRDVWKVLPGHLVALGPDARPGDPLIQHCYWSASEAVDRARSRPMTGSDPELVDALEAALLQSVRARMAADVPVGAFLSGGIDSSTVVALMQQAGSQAVRTFTVGFADRAFDESADAAAVAKHLGTDHTSVEVSDSEAMGVIGLLPDIWDEPFSDVSQIPTYLVSQVARQQVTVSLSGDAGDELFAGYNRHAWLDRLWSKGQTVPPGARRAVGSTLARIPPAAIDRLGEAIGRIAPGREVRNPGTKVAKVAKVLAASTPEAAYLGLTSHWDDPMSMVVGAERDRALAGESGLLQSAPGTGGDH